MRLFKSSNAEKLLLPLKGYLPVEFIPKLIATHKHASFATCMLDIANCTLRQMLTGTRIDPSSENTNCRSQLNR